MVHALCGQGSRENPIDLTVDDASDAQLQGSDLTDLSCMLSPRKNKSVPLPTATPEVGDYIMPVIQTSTPCPLAPACQENADKRKLSPVRPCFARVHLLRKIEKVRVSSVKGGMSDFWLKHLFKNFETPKHRANPASGVY